MQKIVLLIIAVPFLLLACILSPHIPSGTLPPSSGTPEIVNGTSNGTLPPSSGTPTSLRGTPAATASVLRGCWNVRLTADVRSEILRVVCNADVIPQKLEAGGFYSAEYGGYICARSIGWHVDCGE